MRAAEIVERRGPEGREALCATLRAASASPSDLVDAMRGPSIVGVFQRACRSVAAREDLGLLVANPWEPAEDEEIGHVPLFERLGLIERDGDLWHVNADMALALVPSTPWEFGYVATLVARLNAEDTKVLSRAVEVGPRPHPIDFVIDASAAAIDPDRVKRHLAHLTEKDREALHQALELGELPDEVSGLSADSAVAHVTLDPGPAGQRGLLFWLAWPDRDDEARPLVALELQSELQQWLDEVPPAPDVERVRARKRPTRRTATGRKTSPGAPKGPPKTGRNEATPGPASRSITPGNGIRGIVTGPHQQVSMPSGPTLRAPFTTTGGSRAIPAASVRPASALVDLESARLAADARRDPELGASVLDIVAETIVVLHDGVDATDWAERCAARLGFGAN